MKTLILVRHGEFDDDHKLTDDGKRQVQELCDRMRPHVHAPAVVLASPTDRTVQSANIITSALAAPPAQTCTALAYATTEEEQNEIMRLIAQKREQAETLILVTHKPVVDLLPRLYGRNVLKINIPMGKTQYAHGIVIDCDAKTFTEI